MERRPMPGKCNASISNDGFDPVLVLGGQLTGTVLIVVLSLLVLIVLLSLLVLIVMLLSCKECDE